jgi:hydrogenase nickel incorporation protein HypA/HybF
MHELSIALSLIELVEEEAARRHARVVTVHLRVGPLSGVVPETLASAYDLAREGTTLAEAVLLIEEVPLVIVCRACDATHTLELPMDLRCPDCGGPTPEVLGGRELEVVALELDS